MSQQGRIDRLAANPDLNGWKEIAAYLGKSERTAQRWEQKYGLPVRRIQAAGDEVVFALRSEIDLWKLSERGSRTTAEPLASEQGQSVGATQEADALRPARLEPRRRPLVVAGFGLLTVAVLLSAYVWMPHRVPALSSDSPLTRPQGHSFQFHGKGFTPSQPAIRWTRVPNGNEEAMSAPVVAGTDGSVRWALTADCRTETGTHHVWMVDERTKRRSNSVSLVVLRNPECDGPTPDLVARDVASDRASVRPGEEIVVAFSLWNLGTADAVPTTTRIRLGTQSSRTGPSDGALGDHATPAVPIGESRQERAKVVIPRGTIPGVYYLWVVADNGNATIERNSHNNFARSEALVILSP